MAASLRRVPRTRAPSRWKFAQPATRSSPGNRSWSIPRAASNVSVASTPRQTPARQQPSNPKQADREGLRHAGAFCLPQPSFTSAMFFAFACSESLVLSRLFVLGRLLVSKSLFVLSRLLVQLLLLFVLNLSLRARLQPCRKVIISSGALAPEGISLSCLHAAV